MSRLRFLPFFQLNVLLIVFLAAILAGGVWIWIGLAATLVVQIVVNEYAGDDTDAFEGSFTRLLDTSLFAMLPLVCIATAAFIVVASPAPASSAIAVLESVGLGGARATTGAFDIFAGIVWLGLLYSQSATVVGHELVHRTNSMPALIVGRWLLAFTFDTPLAIDHVYGHHRYVGTERDPTTSRRGESVYAFIARSVPGQIASAFRIEASRLKRRGRKPVTFANSALRGHAMSVVVAAGCFGLGGMAGLGLFLACAIWGKVCTELLTYTAHYGLVRAEAGAIEPRHSWNNYRLINGGLLLNLARHSHHHQFPAKPFWKLEAERDGPRHPFGHIVMILISFVPPLWKRVMYPLLEDWDCRLASPEERSILQRRGQLTDGAKPTDDGIVPLNEAAE